MLLQQFSHFSYKQFLPFITFTHLLCKLMSYQRKSWSLEKSHSILSTKLHLYHPPNTPEVPPHKHPTVSWLIQWYSTKKETKQWNSGKAETPKCLCHMLFWGLYGCPVILSLKVFFFFLSLFLFGFTVMLTDKPVEELNATISFPSQSANIEPHPSFLTVEVTVYVLHREKMLEMSPCI